MLGEYIVDGLAEHYSIVYRGEDIVNNINTQLKISISFHQAWHVKQYALL